MSFSFYVPLARAPRLADLAACAEGSWDCPDAPATDPMPEGAVCHPILVGRGARGIELAWENGRLQVRILTCSSRADHALALAIVAHLAKDGALVEAEDAEGPLPLAAVRAAYGDAWIDDQVRVGTIVPLRMARDGGTIGIGGARRSFQLGPRTLAALDAGDPTTIAERLLAAMVELQAPGGDDVYVARHLTVTSPAGESFTVSVWSAGRRYLFAVPDRFAVIARDGSTITIPGAQGPALAANGWRWLDDAPALVEPIEGAAWQRFEDAARRFAIPA